MTSPAHSDRLGRLAGYVLRRVLNDALSRRLRAAAEIGNGALPELALLGVGDQCATFVDVGANEGVFSHVAGVLYERVHVFEPIPDLVHRLTAKLPSNCEVHAVALSDQNGNATFRIPIEGDVAHTQLASLRPFGSNVQVREIDVAVRTLDSFALTSVDLMKIDVEGAEFGVLNGAIETIKRHRPVLIVEIEDRHTKGETKRVFDLLSDLGYEACVLDRSSIPKARKSKVAKLLMGLTQAKLMTRCLNPIDDLIKTIYERDRDLNTSILPDYTNNFVFIPRGRTVRGCKILNRLTTLQPSLPSKAWIARQVSVLSAFDEAWYLEAYPDVAAAGISAAEHYVTFGQREGRLPLPASDWVVKQLKTHRLFDEHWYLESNPDVAASGQDPVEHWVHCPGGGRNPSRSFDTEAYLEQHPEVAGSGENPLRHAFRSGVELERF